MEPFVPPEVAQELGYYVYLYVDPRTGEPFYVGKGKGRRVLAHLSAQGDYRKVRVLEELGRAGLRPRLDVLAHGLANEETALRVEAAVIDVLGLDDLTNEVRGWRSVQLGRVPLEELVAYYAARPVEGISDPVLLIRINRRYRHGMGAQELYEATRGIWKLGPRRGGARYTLAVFEGVVREAYEIRSWHPAGTLEYETREAHRIEDRWEFDGDLAPDEVRRRYVGRSVVEYFPKGLQSPVRYVNC